MTIEAPRASPLMITQISRSAGTSTMAAMAAMIPAGTRAAVIR